MGELTPWGPNAGVPGTLWGSNRGGSKPGPSRRILNVDE